MKKNIFLSLAVATAITFIACSDDNNTTASISEIETPITDKAKNSLQVVNTMSIGDDNYTISYNKLMRTGDADNGEVYGLLKDENDQPLKMADGSNYICNGTSNPDGSGSGLDFISILNKNDKLYLVSQFECQIGAYYISELEQDSKGALTPKKDTLQYISQKDFKGGYVHCAGMKTPWESHLGSEEYEPNARKLQADGTLDDYYDHVAAYFGGDLTKASPYYYGWTPEVQIDANGTPEYIKHYSMGRMSHELSYVMPDRKTVYLSDDGTNVGLFKFVADTAEDLSAGTLYAAKWNQTSAANGGSANLDWINLGHASNADIQNIALDVNTKIGDYFEFSDYNETTGCAAGFTSINTSAYTECIKLADGANEIVASRLETRRYAALKGATTEFRKEEGITYDAARNKLYVAMSAVAYGMEDNQKKGEANTKYDLGGNNDIKVAYNPCGAIYELDVDANMNATNMKSILMGAPASYDENSTYAGNKCHVDAISNPDNVTFIEGSNLLVIGEDTGSHVNNVVWTYNVVTKELTRVLTTPVGAETTSPFWYSDVNGHGYMTVVTQHPDNETTMQGQSEAGYVGPFSGFKK